MPSILTLSLLLLSSTLYATTYVSPSLKPIIEENPPKIVSCRVQALILPTAAPHPQNQTNILTELLEKGIKIDRILPHDRLGQGSFYAFGEVNETVLVDKIDLQVHKVKIAALIRRGFIVSFNYRTIEESIKLLGCTIKQLE